MIECFLPMQSPPTKTAQQGARTTKTGRHYIDPELKSIKDQYRQALISHKPASPINNQPVRLIAKFLYPTTKNTSHGQPKTTKPDCDNLIKTLQDALQECGFFNNDCQVASLIVEKFHSDVTGIYLKIESLPSPVPLGDA